MPVQTTTVSGSVLRLRHACNLGFSIKYREIYSVEVCSRAFSSLPLLVHPSAMYYVQLWLLSALRPEAHQAQRQLSRRRPIKGSEFAAQVVWFTAFEIKACRLVCCLCS